MVAPKERSKRIGKYAIYLWEHYDTFYNSNGRPTKGKFDFGEVAVFISGKEKSLQGAENYENRTTAISTYNKLSSVNAIERWIKDRGY